MSISSSIRKAGPYNGDGIATVFPFVFKVFQPSEVLVVKVDAQGAEATLTMTTDYTVALNVEQDTNPGGSVNMLTAPAVGFRITLGSNVDALQDLTLTNQGGFYPKVINDALDRITIVAQQILNKLGGVLKVGITDGSIGSLPSKGMRSDMGLGFDANGDPIAVPLSNLVDAISRSEKGSALGVATLDVNSKLVQMPTPDDIDPAIQTHITSPHAPVAAQANRPFATNAQALAGTNNTVDMSPLRVKEVLNANLPAINHGLNQGFKMIANTAKSAIGYQWMAAVTFNNEIVVWGRHDTTYLVMGHNANPIGFTTIQHHPSKEGVLVKQIEQFPWGIYVLYEDGDVYSLGYGAYSNLGIGNATNQRRLVFSIGGVAVLSASSIGHHYSSVHAMVVKTDGTVWGVGQNTYGQLGVGDNLNKPSWTQAALPVGETAVDVIAINTNVAMSVVRTTSGKLYSTGYNGYGQLGVGDVTNRNAFTLVQGLALETVVNVVSSGGGYNADYRWCLNCLTQSGKVFTWGAGTWGDGVGGVAQHNLPTEIAYGHNNTTDPVRSITHLSQGLYCCMSYITTNNDLYTWGYNAYGQLGDGTLVDKNSPTFIMAGVDFIHGSCGIYDDYYVTVHAKKLDGTVWGWGYSGYYTVGNAIAGSQSTPQQIWIPDSANITQFAHCGYGNTYTVFALLSDGRLYAWGYNGHATCTPLQLATSTQVGTPTRVN